MNNKILAIGATPYFSDRGCHVRIYNTIKYLEPRGYDIRLCTYHLGYNPEGLKAEVIRIPNIPWYKKITPGASIHKPYLDLLLLFKVIQEYFKFKPNFIIAYQHEALAIASVLKVLTLGKAKIIFDCQGSLPHEMIAYTLNKKKWYKVFIPIFRLAERFLLLFADKIMCSSVNSYNFLKQNYNIKDDKISILQDGIDMDLFNNISGDKVAKLKERFQVPEGNKVIIYTGTINTAKGVDALLDKLPEILENNKNITFIFAGYGDLIEEYTTKLVNYIDNRKVIFAGRVNYFDLPTYLKLADFAVEPKIGSSESSGKLFNYIAGNLPVICFKSEFNEKILKDSGIYINSFLEINKALLNKSYNMKTKVPEELLWQNIVLSNPNFSK